MGDFDDNMFNRINNHFYKHSVLSDDDFRDMICMAQKDCDAVLEGGKKYQDEELQYCYDKGFDNIKNGSNATNSNYAIFSTDEKLKAWQHGRDDANHAKSEEVKNG